MLIACQLCEMFNGWDSQPSKSMLTVKIDFILEIKLILNACIVDDGVELHGIWRLSVNLLTSGYFCTMPSANFFRLLLSVFISNSTVSNPDFASSSSMLLRLPTAITRGLLCSLARARARPRPMPAVAPVTRMHLLSSMEGIMCRLGLVTTEVLIDWSFKFTVNNKGSWIRYRWR